jgi:hypothetical protein
MKFTLNNLIPVKATSYKILFYIALFFFFSLGIFIQQLSLKSLDTRIKKIQLEVEEQKELHSTYQLLKNNEQKNIPTLPLAKSGNISRDQIESLPGNFREITRKANLDMIYIRPDMNSIGPDSKYLLVNLGMRGDFFNFRKFLTNLGNVSFLDRIEEIQIQEKADAMEFRMTIRLAMI